MPLVAIPSSTGNPIFLIPKEFNTDIRYLDSCIDDWVDEFLPNNTNNKSTSNIAIFSNDCKYLVTSDVKGIISIWLIDYTNFTNTSFIRQFECSNESHLYDIRWGLDSNDDYLIVSSYDSFSVINDVIQSAISESSITTQTHEVTTNSTINNKLRKGNLQLGALLASTPVKSMDSLTIKSNIREIKETKDSKVNYSPDDDDNLLDDEVDSKQKDNKVNRVINDDIDDSSINGMIIDDQPTIQPIKHTSFYLPSNQPPFQSSCTKPDEEEDVSNRIEFRFSNVNGSNKPESFIDNYRFNKGVLAYEGAFFSNAADPITPSNEDDIDIPSTKGSVLYYHAFANQSQLKGANESFTFTMADNEDSLAIAVGKGWCATATSKQLLRIFSSTGLQISITLLKGPIVTLSVI
eukprot:gene18264-23939_t